MSSTLVFPALSILFAASLVLAVRVFYHLYQNRSSLPLPPGPKSHWLHGNEIPSHPWRKFAEYTKQYGPLFSMRLNKQLLVVVGTFEAASDIMEKQGASLADRPRSIAAGETMSGGMRVLLLQNGDRLKKLRRALHAHLQPKMAEAYEDIQAKASKAVIQDILEKPDQFPNHAKRYAASVIMSLTYGKTTPTSYSDPEVQEINKFLFQLGQALKPGRYAVDSYPILKYVPGYLSELHRYHESELALFTGQYENVRRQMMSGKATPSFAKYLIERQDEYGLSNDEAAYLCGSMFGAGSDTTAGAMMVAVMAAACYPEAQYKAQEQLDLVVGQGRMPAFGDWDDLPYISAFVSEVYRWRPVSAAGFMHRATEDIVYKGYLIPKGASVVGNHWSIHHDPAVFPDPEVFRPERWLDEGGRIRDDLRTYNFGFGRRVCPGMHVANRSLFINTANILWAFRISEDPMARIDRFAFTDTANSHPLPFKVRFEDRFPKMAQVVKEAF